MHACTHTHSLWLQANQLVINVENTNTVKFTCTASSCDQLDIKYKDQTLIETNSMKFLGVQLDCHLNWKTYKPITM
jgi:hypothetical protein